MQNGSLQIPAKQIIKKQVAPSNAAAAIKSINFTAQEGVSEYRIGVEGSIEIEEAVKEGTIVKFGIKNASISRALRRVYTAIAFPTAVQSVTPYLIEVVPEELLPTIPPIIHLLDVEVFGPKNSPNGFKNKFRSSRITPG